MSGIRWSTGQHAKNPKPKNWKVSGGGDADIAWVKEQIVKYGKSKGYDVMKRGGVDLDGSGFVESRERLTDANGNNYTGDNADFVAYFRNHREEILSKIHFFRYAASLNPGKRIQLGNPIHDRMTRESMRLPAVRIAKTYKRLAGILRLARKRVGQLRSTAYAQRFVLSALNLATGRIAFAPALRFSANAKLRQAELSAVYSVLNSHFQNTGTIIATLVDAKRLNAVDCKTSFMIAQGIGFELGIRNFFAIRVPLHLYGRVVDGENSFNIDRGVIRNDAEYVKVFNITNTAHMKPLNYREQRAYNFFTEAHQFWKAGKFKRAMQNIKAARDIYPAFADASFVGGLIAEELAENAGKDTRAGKAHLRKALELFRHSRSLRPDQGRHYLKTAHVLFALGDAWGALTILNRGITVLKNNLPTRSTHPAIVNARKLVLRLSHDFKRRIQHRALLSRSLSLKNR